MTLGAVLFAWAFFRAENWDAALIMSQGMVGLNGVYLPESYVERLGGLAVVLQNLGVHFAAHADAVVYPTRTTLIFLIMVYGFVFIAPNSQEWVGGARAKSGETAGLIAGLTERLSWTPNKATGTAMASLTAVAMLVLLQQKSSAFIYFQF